MNKLSWDIQSEASRIADNLRAKRRAIKLSPLIRKIMGYAVKVVGTAITSIIAIRAAQENIWIAIPICLGMCALFGWISLKVEGSVK